MARFWAWLRAILGGKPPTRKRRRLRPGVAFLEERQTPSVTAVSFAAITPAPGARDTVQVSGVIVDDHNDAVGTAGLKASFQAIDTAGHVIKSGPVSLSPLTGNDTGFSFPIAFSTADRGQRELIAITAFDQDNQAAHTTVVARTDVQLPTSARPGYRDISLGSNGKAGVFQGIIHGQGTVGRTAGGASVATGRGTYIIDGFSDVGEYHAAGKGAITLKADPLGAINTSLTGKSAFAFPSGTAAGLDATVQGRSVFNRGIDRSLAFHAEGTFIPSVALKNAQLQGGGKGQITLRSNGSGHFALSMTGHLVLKGNSPLRSLLEA